MPYLIIARILGTMNLNRPQQKFLLQLLKTWLAVRGRFNFTNFSRYGPWGERTLRRHFARAFAWPQFQQRLLEHLVPAEHEVMAALDASFVPKRGKHTSGLGYFFNGCASRVEKGLELSLVSVVDVTRNTAYALSAAQTPNEVGGKAGKPVAGKPVAGKPVAAEETRMDAYLEHFTAVRNLLPPTVRHLAVDGYYTCAKFVNGVCSLNLEVVGKLRCDANMRYLYHGQKQGRGRPRQYAGKVQWSHLDRRRWKREGEVEPGVTLTTATLYHMSLKRVVRVARLEEQQAGKLRRVLLFSTDVQLSGRDIVRYYSARYQIEFLFRDAKQATGLNHCQARNAAALHFHWNAAFCALNLAKWQEAQRAATSVFSVFSCKQRCSNEHLLEVFSAKLGLDWMWIKSHPAYSDLCNYGVIHP